MSTTVVTPRERAIAIAEQRKAGLKLREIAAHHGFSIERARQLILKGQRILAKEAVQ